MSLTSALRPPLHFVAASCLLAAVPASAIAQLEIAGQVGSFLPTGHLFAFELGAEPGFEDERYRQQVAIALGGRVAYRVSPRLALEVAILHAPSELARIAEPPLVTGSESERPLEASVLAVTLRGRWRPGPAVGRVRPHLLVGGGMVSRGGRAYGDDPLGRSLGLETAGTVDPALVIGGGLDVRVTSRLAVRLELADYLSISSFAVTRQVDIGSPSTVELSDVTLESHSRLQNELILTQSVVFAIGDPWP